MTESHSRSDAGCCIRGVALRTYAARRRLSAQIRYSGGQSVRSGCKRPARGLPFNLRLNAPVIAKLGASRIRARSVGAPWYINGGEAGGGSAWRQGTSSNQTSRNAGAGYPARPNNRMPGSDDTCGLSHKLSRVIGLSLGQKLMLIQISMRRGTRSLKGDPEVS